MGFKDGDVGGFKDVVLLVMVWFFVICIVIVVDFDNDGYEEFFFNNIGDVNCLFR